MEIEKILRSMLDVRSSFVGYQFVVAAAPSISAEIYQSLIPDSGIKLVFNQTYALLKHAEAALVTSGTATLEAALLDCPQVVCYKGNPLSFIFARLLVHVKFISLVNLIMEKSLVKELIQAELTKENIVSELKSIIENPENQKRIHKGYLALRERLGGSGASARAASLMEQYLFEKKSVGDQISEFLLPNITKFFSKMSNPGRRATFCILYVYNISLLFFIDIKV